MRTLRKPRKPTLCPVCNVLLRKNVEQRADTYITGEIFTINYLAFTTIEFTCDCGDTDSWP